MLADLALKKLKPLSNRYKGKRRFSERPFYFKMNACEKGRRIERARMKKLVITLYLTA